MKNTKSLSSMTKLQAETESKRRAAEQAELIDEMGQESDFKAKSVINFYMKQIENAEKQVKDEALEILEGLKKKGNQDYNNFLKAALARFLSQEDIPIIFNIKIIANKKGLIVSISGTDYYGAFASTYLPYYDYVACKILATKVGNTIAKMQGFNQSHNGILIPDSEDLKNYGYRRSNKSSVKKDT